MNKHQISASNLPQFRTKFHNDFAPNSLRFRTKFITISHQIHYDFAPISLRFRTKSLQFRTKLKLEQNCNRNKFGAKS